MDHQLVNNQLVNNQLVNNQLTTNQTKRNCLFCSKELEPIHYPGVSNHNLITDAYCVDHDTYAKRFYAIANIVGDVARTLDNNKDIADQDEIFNVINHLTKDIQGKDPLAKDLQTKDLQTNQGSKG